ncbi:MAG: flagellar protein FlaG [Thermotogaceae bacterium]|nr:flagellar protein FlaG [Thermotogaceae bacterium]
MKVNPTDGVGKLERNPVIVEETMNLKKAIEDKPNTGTEGGLKIDDERNLEDILKDFKKKLEKLKLIFRGEAEFSIDRDTNMVIVKIKDKETGEIIRQIPPEVVLKIAKSIEEFLGLLLDERA